MRRRGGEKGERMAGHCCGKSDNYYLQLLVFLDGTSENFSKAIPSPDRLTRILAASGRESLCSLAQSVIGG